MEDWQKELIDWVETVRVAVEDFLDEVGQAVEEIAEEVHSDFVGDLEQFLQDVWEPVIDFSSEDNGTVPSSFWEDTELMVSPKINPSSNVHPACQGCHHYHGRVYGQNLLVCAMHPYGWEDPHCPDWEADSVDHKTS